jgi:transcriptional regulator with XRE-family HTH domain
MAGKTALLEVLKRALKAHGQTYARVARHLGLSEASVKRMLSTGHITLERVERICELMDMDIAELAALLEEQRHRVTHLTREQEEELVGDARLLLVAVCARNHWTLRDITRTYQITEHEGVRLLARLDRLRLIDLLPGNRIKLRVAENFQWLPGGPIERYFERHVQQEFLGGPFGPEDGVRLFLSGMLSRASQQILLRRVRALAEEFATLHRQDTALPVAERRNVGLALATRPWELAAFARLRRPPAP